MSGRRKSASIEHDSVGSTDRRSKDDVVDGMQEKLAELEAKRVEEETPLEPEIRANLRELVFLGSMRETVDFNGFVFVMKTLNNTETAEFISDLSLYDIKDRGMALRTMALARSIVSVNGSSLESLYEEEDDLSVMEKKYYIINSWQNSLVNALFEEYEKLMAKSKEVFSSESMGDKVKN